MIDKQRARRLNQVYTLPPLISAAFRSLFIYLLYCVPSVPKQFLSGRIYIVYTTECKKRHPFSSH